MRKTFIAGAAALVFALPVPAGAVSFVTTDGLNGSATLDSSDTEDFTFQVDFIGFGGDPATEFFDLTATIFFTFTGVSNSGLTYNFDFDIRNTADVDSRLTAFGFSVDPNVSDATSTGQFDISIVYPNGTMPNYGPVEVCFKDAGNPNNCAGSKNGVDDGAAALGTLALTFGDLHSTIVLDGFVVRYQGIEGIPDLGQDGSAIGRGTVVPEPATWALMIAGFGLVGGALRSRRRASFATA